MTSIIFGTGSLLVVLFSYLFMLDDIFAGGEDDQAT